MQQREQRRHLSGISAAYSAYQLPPAKSADCFGIGCQDLLPAVSGRYRQVPRPQRLCSHCPADCVGYEEHLVLECSALDRIRHRHMFSVLFLSHLSVRSFMNQDSQRDVLHFVCECLDYCSLLTDVFCRQSPMIWTADLIDEPVDSHLQIVQLVGGGKLHPAAAATTLFERQLVQQ